MFPHLGRECARHSSFKMLFSSDTCRRHQSCSLMCLLACLLFIWYHYDTYFGAFPKKKIVGFRSTRSEKLCFCLISGIRSSANRILSCHLLQGEYERTEKMRQKARSIETPMGSSVSFFAAKVAENTKSIKTTLALHLFFALVASVPTSSACTASSTNGTAACQLLSGSLCQALFSNIMERFLKSSLQGTIFTHYNTLVLSFLTPPFFFLGQMQQQ